jgi:outer membrane protein assembly factor BamB
VNRRYAHRAAATVVVVLALAGGFGMIGAGATRATTRSTSVVSDEWSVPEHDVQRTNASADTTISPATAHSLRRLWVDQTGGPIVPAPTVAGGVAYFSSWDGNEYAVNARTGAVLWKAFMGVLTANPVCIPPKAGPSTPSVLVNGTVLTGGADGYFYDLNAKTGAVEWRVWTWGSNPPGVYDGHFDWSPALIIGNYAYIGIASLGDCPLVQGKLLKLNLTTHQLEGALDFVPNGQVGGGTWTEPAYDPADGLIYVSSATINQKTQSLPQSIVAINPATLQIVAHWMLPPAESIGDSDFGTSTTLFSDAGGHPMLASINKNGIDYGFNRATLSSGPLWRQYIALGSPCPTCDASSVSSQAYGAGKLYAAGGRGAIDGVVSSGTVRALNPDTGAYIWQHGAPGDVLAALTYDNGMVIDAAGSYLEVLDAKSGARLFSYDTGAQIYAATAVADGIVYVGNTAGALYAFGLPRTKHRRPADRHCPSGFTCQDIGRPAPRGSEANVSSCPPGRAGVACAGMARAGRRVRIKAGGSGVGGTSDSFRLLSRPTRGTDQVAAQVVSQPRANGSQVGVMIRQSEDPASPYYALLEGPNHTLIVEYRLAFGGQTMEPYYLTGRSLPLYLMIQRRGDVLQAATSSDGRRFTLIPGTDATVPMPARSLGGVVVSSGAQRRAQVAVISRISVGAPTRTPIPVPPAHRCPPGWSCQEIGNPGLVGDQQLSGGSWTLRAAGFDIWDTRDQFHFVWKAATGEPSVAARVTSVTDTSSNTKAGVMLRAGADPRAAYYAVYVTGALGIQVQYRDQTSEQSNQLANPAGTAPAYLRVTRSGNVFTAYTSSDGVNWTAIPGSGTALPDLAGSLLGGIALCSHDGLALAAASFEAVSIG